MNCRWFGRRPSTSICLLLCVACSSLCLACGPDRTVYVGGPILTVDASDRVVEALGVEGDRIGAVGSAAEVRAWAGESARIVDLAGRTVVPGFIDAHGHFPGEGVWDVVVDLRSPPISDVADIHGLVQRLGERADATPEGEWIVGMGYDDTLLIEGRHPTRRDLDRASTRHPVAILHVSGHLAVLNTAALKEVGIDKDTPDPEGGVIRRNARGRPNGVLEEEAMHPIEKRVLSPAPLDSLRIVRSASERYLAAGVTTAQNGYAPKFQIQAFAWLGRLRLLPLRLVMWPDPEVADAVLAGELALPTPDPDRVRMGAIKIVADGSIQGYTGYLSEPYHVPPGDDPGYRGYPRVSREELIEQVARYHAAGMQVAVHGNGDASIDDILDAFEEAQRRHPREDARPVVIHAQMARPDQLERMAALGVIPSFFSLHTFYWGDRHRTIFMGEERASRMSPAASADALGLRFTIHCDAPVVPMEPLRLIGAAVGRHTRSGVVVGPEERIPVMRALRAVTLDAARQHFEEDRKGSLEVGKLADLVILSDDPRAVDPTEIAGIRVLETVVGGESAFVGD
ncbi:MAG: amidohydrolase [Myxococcales bacterium]|nr:amidohydrolase [Myxococcales bacterium]